VLVLELNKERLLTRNVAEFVVTELGIDAHTARRTGVPYVGAASAHR
jgi:hypothetical protein